MFYNIRQDYKANGLHFKKLWIMIIYRLGNNIYYSKIPKFIKFPILIILNIIRKIFVEILFQVQIPFECKIGYGLRLMHPHSIVVHKNVKIGKYCNIFHEVTVGSNEHKDPKKLAQIGDNVYIGCGAKIIGDVTIGDNAKIGANAVVVKNVPPDATIYCQQIIKFSS